MLNNRTNRKLLPHIPPFWIAENAIFFITINCQKQGENQLANEGMAKSLIDSWLFYRDQGKCAPLLVLVMPDHLHLLVSFSWDIGEGMSALVKSWKRFTAKQNGIQWQRNYFDHRIRNEDSFHQKWDYIINNPVSAGLTNDPDNWPHKWISPHAEYSE